MAHVSHNGNSLGENFLATRSHLTSDFTVAALHRKVVPFSCRHTAIELQ